MHSADVKQTAFVRRVQPPCVVAGEARARHLVCQDYTARVRRVNTTIPNKPPSVLGCCCIVCLSRYIVKKGVGNRTRKSQRLIVFDGVVFKNHDRHHNDSLELVEFVADLIKMCFVFGSNVKSSCKWIQS